MKPMHRLLKRQLKKAEIDQQTLVLITPLLEQVNEAYMASDKDLFHIENVLEKSSQELFQANQQLKSNVEIISSRLAKVAGNIQEVIFEIDLNGNWSYLNPAWEKLTGFKVEDCLGKHYSDYLMDNVGQPLKDVIDLSNPNFTTSSRSIESLTPDGQKKWLEILGAGMVHPKVLENVGINNCEWSGYAFGFGIDRIAMIRYNISDIRHFYNSDLRFFYNFKNKDI